MPDPAAQQTLRMLAIVAMIAANLLVFIALLQQPSSTQVAPASLDPGYRISINHADANDLQLLHGVGPSLAGNIIQYRKSRGPFESTQQLLNVNRIGPKTLARFEPWVKID